VADNRLGILLLVMGRTRKTGYESALRVRKMSVSLYSKGASPYLQPSICVEVAHAICSFVRSVACTRIILPCRRRCSTASADPGHSWNAAARLTVIAPPNINADFGRSKTGASRLSSRTEPLPKPALHPVCPLNRLTYSGGVIQSIELSSDRVIENVKNVKNGAVGVPDLETL